MPVLLHPREIQILWSQTVRQRETKTTAINQGKASEMLAYLVRERNRTSQTRKIWKIRTEKTKNPTGVLKNVMQEDQKGCKKNNIRPEERGPKLMWYRLTWFLCGWWSKLTRFLDAGRKSLGFSVSIEIELVLSWWSILTWFQCEGLNLTDFSLGIGIDLFRVWGSKTTWF